MAEIALQRGEYIVSAQQYLSLAQQSENPEFARRSTELAYDYGFDAHALASAERWVELEPDDPDALGYLGRLYVRRNFLDLAWEYLDKALPPLEQRTDASYTLLSVELSEAAYPDRSLKIFERFNTTYPDTPGITAAIAGLAAQAGDMARAIEAARETVALAPQWTEARIWLARFLLLEGEHTNAFDQMAFVLEMNPGLEMEIEFINLLVAAGEIEEAYERLGRLGSRYPDEPELVRARAIILMRIGDLPGARAEFFSLLADAYFVNECFWYLGQIAFNSGNYLQAIRYFDRVSTGEWLIPARLASSQAYVVLGDPDTALQVQREFAASYPKRAFDTFSAQAEILANMGQTNEALAILGKAIEYKPWNENLWMFRGGILEESGNLAQSLEAFRRAYALAPENATVLNALGYTLTTSTRRYDEAHGYISQALKKEPDNPAIMDSMGWVLFKQGKLEDAKKWLEQAYALLPDPEVAAHLGELNWTQGDEDAAITIWTEALQISPDSSVLNDTISRFLK
ncbi:MAG: tetratricopeptide repeat protein [Gammaproteobacteria bacterium]|nr:tetratricopeptide repeat protein [Gammaproteobacteria bacterium]MDP6616169.1 tetratricopeptide repeat protein [Gammaproteobacteria bacterium]MDP6695623.1 tetratricopeptide repeat protein [Gammaproteobacteria bacterium]